MLDAIVAATEHLVVTYTGANETHRTATPSGRTPRRAPRHPRRHRRGRQGAGAAATPAPGLRPAQPRRCQAVLVRPGRARRAPGPPRGRGSRHPTSPTSSSGHGGRRRAGCAGLLPQAPGPGVPAPPAGDRARRRGRGGDRRPPVELDGLAQWQSVTGCCTTSRPAAPAGDPREGVAPRRTPARHAGLAAGAEDRRPGGTRGGGRGVGDPGHPRRRARHRRRPRRRASAARHGHRPLRRPRREGELLPARPAPPPRCVGAVARAVRRLPGRPWSAGAIGRGDFGRATDRTAFASVDDAGDVAARPGDDLRRRHARAAAAAAEDRPRVGERQPAQRPGQGRRTAGRRGGSATRTRTTRTCGSGEPTLRWPPSSRSDRCPARRSPTRTPGSVPWRSGCGSRSWSGAADEQRTHDDRRDMEPFDLLGELPSGTTLLEASAGTGQDLRGRRAGGPLRRRGRGAARRDAGDHLRPRGQPGAARAGPRAAGRGRARARPTRPPRARSVAWWACSPTVTSHDRHPAQAAAGRPGRLRRGDHRDHPPVLPVGAALARGRGRHRLGRRAGRQPRRPGGRGGRRRLPPALRPPRRRPALQAAGRPPARAGGGQRPAGRARPRRRRRRAHPPTSGTPSPRRCAPRSTGASAASASCRTTTC